MGIGVIAFAGEQGDPIQVFVLQDCFGVACGHEFVFTHFVGVSLAPGMDAELVTVFKGLQVCKDAGLVVGIPDVAGEDGVACPGGRG